MLVQGSLLKDGAQDFVKVMDAGYVGMGFAGVLFAVRCQNSQALGYPGGPGTFQYREAVIYH